MEKKLENHIRKRVQKCHIRERVQKHYEFVKSLGYDVIYCAAQGSMNYNLFMYDDEYKSDVDTKVLVIPTLNDLIKGNKMISKKYDFEGEQVDVKDIRFMMELWKKQNQSYLEILFTDFYIISDKYEKYFMPIKDMRNDIVRMNLPQLARCIRGMASEKVVALEHPYPATINKIADHGFDEKQIASTIRLAILMENIFIFDKDFKESIWLDDESDNRKLLINIKKCKTREGKPLTLDEARDIMEQFDLKCHNLKQKVVEQYGKDLFNSAIYDKLQNHVYKLVEYGIKEAIMK